MKGTLLLNKHAQVNQKNMTQRSNKTKNNNTHKNICEYK